MQFASETPQYSRHTEYIEMTPSIRIVLELIAPRTALYIPNEAWIGKAVDPLTVRVDVLENLVFTSLYPCRRFLEMAGQNITTLNRCEWDISVNAETGMPCFTAASGGTAETVCITECDLIGQNGIAHEIEAPLLVDSSVLPEAPAPTAAPTQTYSPTRTPAPTLAPTTVLSDTERMKFMPLCLETLETVDTDQDGAIR